MPGRTSRPFKAIRGEGLLIMLDPVSIPGPVFGALLVLAWAGLGTCLRALSEHVPWSIKIVRKEDKRD
jgi:hypothetical protein